MVRRVLVVGLDSAAPELMFKRFIDKLPNTRGMTKKGIHGRMRSSDPPITIPAWAVMVTSRSPGRLGMYGFRHRKGSSYTEFRIANSTSLGVPAIWDVLGSRGKRSCLVGIPPSFPPFPVDGWLISGFITPSTRRPYTYPPELRDEVESLIGEYVFDVRFRTEERDGLLRDLDDMSERQYKVMRHLLTTKPWDFYMFVDIGMDRVQHAFWKYFDEQHHLHKPGTRFENAVEDYYRRWDERIGELLSLVDDDTAVIVVSDHGAKRMKGCFCVNEWLIRQGYLKLRKGGNGTTSLEEVDVDWNRTIAWGWGGYYARIFVNVKGREEHGVVDPKDYERVLDELIRRIKDIRGPDGERWKTEVHKPEELYGQCEGDYPDLMVYFDDLSWRSAGTIGHGTLYLPENDIGPDDAVHSRDGIFILYDPREDYGGQEVRVDILDVAPTILHLMGVSIPSDFEGRVIEEVR